jgi:hypothetical protein
LIAQTRGDTLFGHTRRQITCIFDGLPKGTKDSRAALASRMPLANLPDTIGKKR